MMKLPARSSIKIEKSLSIFKSETGGRRGIIFDDCRSCNALSLSHRSIQGNKYLIIRTTGIAKSGSLSKGDYSVGGVFFPILFFTCFDMHIAEKVVDVVLILRYTG